MTIQAIWSVESNNNDIDGSGVESGDEQELNLTIMT
jgi:hypothetical protein